MQSRISLIALTLAIALATSAAQAKTKLTSSRRVGDVNRVVVKLEVGGTARIKDGEKLRELPLSVVGALQYDERFMTVGEHASSVRYYHVAQASIKVDKTALTPRLGEAHRTVAVDEAATGLTLFALDTPLNREELDLIDVPGNSLILDKLLPSAEVDAHDQWELPGNVLAAILGIDAVKFSAVTAELKELGGGAAKVELTGKLSGAIDGVSTDIELKGRYKFDLKDRRITWFALLIKENRSIGHIGPGLDVVAKLQMTMAETEKPAQLADAALAGRKIEATPENSVLACESPNGHYRFLYSHEWHVLDEHDGSIAMRMIDRGELVAQCNISALTPGKTGSLATLAEFQSDVEKSLGKNFGQFVSASEGTTHAGFVLYRVCAAGKVEDLPIQWNYYLISAADGRRVVLAFTFETEQSERLGNADERIVSSMQLTGPPPGGRTAQPTPAVPERSADASAKPASEKPVRGTKSPLRLFLR